MAGLRAEIYVYYQDLPTPYQVFPLIFFFSYSFEIAHMLVTQDSTYYYECSSYLWEKVHTNNN